MPLMPVSRKGVMTFFEVDNEDVYFVSLHNWSWSTDGAPRATIKGKTVSIGEFILKRMGISVPKGMEVDHIDTNFFNNQRSNLRIATRRQQECNKGLKCTNKTGYKGVFEVGNRYRAQITYKYKRIHLGYFNTLEEGHEAYKKAALKYFGEFANFG